MRKFLLSAVALLSSIVITTSAQVAAPTLYGNLIYTRSWGNEDASNAGIYKFTADASGDVSLAYRPENTNIYANGGAVYVDGKYYVLTHVPNTGKIQKNTLYTYDADSWTLLEQKEAPLTTSANDLTWSPVDGKIYGVFLNATSSGYVFGTLDVTDGSVETIKVLDLKYNNMPMSMLALAADSNGDIFGVGCDGNLYRFDRATGDHTLIGDTGFRPALWNQSGCFDFTTKEMYWAACNADVSALFKIDIETGAATKVRTFSDDEEFVGLYSTSGIADIEGPQSVSDFTVTLDGSALTGSISFTLPSATIAGAALSGNIDYTVEDNGAVLLQGSAAAGSAVNREVTFTEGVHSLIVYASQGDNRGASVRTAVYAGNDSPAAPASVTAAKDGDKVTISWTAVTTGANKGYIDPAAVTYTVTRMPDGKIIAESIAATTCTDSELPSALGDYTYDVCAAFSGKTGPSASSGTMTLGKSFEAPLAFNLTTEDDFKFFTVIDANNDASTWEWSRNGTMCRYNRNNDSDDWLITPMITLKAGYRYTITLEMRSGNGRTAETYDIMAGNAPTAEALTIPVVEGASLADTKRNPHTVTFTPDTDGNYCFGVHCTSPKYQYSLYVYTFAIDEPVSLKAPIASETVSATAAPGGVLEATVKAIAPSTAVDGTPLASLEKAEITNLTTGRLAGTVSNPAPGTEISVEDKAAANGTNEYSVVFFNAAGKGYAAKTSVYVGEDTPADVTDVVLRQTGDKAVLTWKAPTEGKNGGYINPANLRYRVLLVSTKADVVTGLDECTFIDESQETETQHALQYTVFASNVAGESAGLNSNLLTFGRPYDAPFAESFAEGKETMAPWTTVQEGSGYPDWSASTKSIYDDTDPSQDADLGWMKYASKGTISLQSPIINISPLNRPVLKFWHKATDEGAGSVSLDVRASADRGVTWQTLKTIDVSETGWAQLSADLTAFKGCQTLQIAFRASTSDYQDMYLDNIRIADHVDKDLGITSFTGPTSLDAGSTGRYSLRLVNNGSTVASGYNVSIFGNDRLLTIAKGEDIAAYAAAVLEIDVTIPVNFTETELKAAIDFAGDEFGPNNEAVLAVTATEPRFPTIGTLTATSEGSGIKLSWSRPAEERNPSAVIDDLENLTAWDFGGVTDTNPRGSIGDYTVYDADGKSTVVVASYYTQPNAYEPMAYQVGKTAEPGNYTDLNLKNNGVNARSGYYSLIAWGAVEGASSDWLILPELFPGETKISFWAHAAAMGWGASPDEKLEVYYSTSGNDIADFVSLGEPVAVPAGFESDSEKGFRFYEFQLPDNAKYAAIRVELSTESNKAVVIDDICFTAASLPMESLEIKGFNIYRDGEKIGTADTEEYLDQTATGNHVYNVTTSYHLGESPFSNDAEAAVSGIEDVVIDSTDGELRFFNLQGLEVKNPVRGNVYIVVSPDGTSAKRVLR